MTIMRKTMYIGGSALPQPLTLQNAFFVHLARKEKHKLKLNLAILAALISTQISPAAVTVLVDQVGYETSAPKQVILVGSAGDKPHDIALIDVSTRNSVLTVQPSTPVTVDHWGRIFWIADLSACQKPGRYIVAAHTAAGEVQSSIFVVEDDVLERNNLSNVIYYFKGQRSSGLIDAADRHLQSPYSPGTFLDVHGGWYDATGDYGIHLSHQNLTSYFNPQQVPLVAWTLLKDYCLLLARKDNDFSEYERRLLDEGLFGADFLVRIKRPNGSFFESIIGPGAAKLPKDRAIGNPNWRTQIKKTTTDSTEQIASATGPHAYEASFRAGGGVAIAALAFASTLHQHGDFDSATYVAAAKDAYQFLDEHNRELLNDGKENILDDYCALLAATELYAATKDETYHRAADKRADSLLSRLVTNPRGHDYWRADDATRPFFHPSDAGLPVVSLLEYSTIAYSDRQIRVRDVVKRSLESELKLTEEVPNPFGYARQVVRMGNGYVRRAFFFPHDTEAAPWWQGEDARLASLAGAARMALPLFSDDPAFQTALRNYAWNQLHWILGRNPFDTSLLIGSGHGDAAYMFFRSYKYTNAPGAIVNGITSAQNDPDGIAFNQGFAVTGQDEDWRWTEEWLPHAAWYLYAVCLPH
jgi:Glycosyl hydrolase family 9/Cellulase N-terminal ig-like domain